MQKEGRERNLTVIRRTTAAVIVLVLFTGMIYLGQYRPFVRNFLDEETVEAADWERILSDLGFSPYQGSAENTETEDQKEELSLYARAAVLIDGDSGRVLYGKDETTEYPMASTTKIMTGILALEYGNLDDEVTISPRASGQPEVRLGVRTGETYIMRDLIYAMMLTSYNDCAVAIAEHIAGSVEEFAGLMNQKARDLGCYSTWYITPNGLDSEDEGGVHRTSAEDLARVTAYAIRNEDFLTITRTASHSFTDCSGKRSFTAVNKNAFLTMMDGALSGKTGFTGKAGYCYTGALRRDGRTFVVAVLGSGWPPQKTRKWSDTRTLMNYGLKNYQTVKIGLEDTVTEGLIAVEGGIANKVSFSLSWETREILAGVKEQISAKVNIPEKLSAPIRAGSLIGWIILYLEDEPVLMIPAILDESVEEFSLCYCIEHIFAEFFDIFS